MDFVGYIDAVTRFYVTGWVADRSDWSRSLRVDIIVGGEQAAVVDANLFREGLTKLNEASTGLYAFRYYFAGPLSLFDAQEIVVRVNKTQFHLSPGTWKLGSPHLDRDISEFRPQAPILLSTMGRTGSTAVMAELAQHPNIVVAGKRPYEVEMACYYAYALRTLAAEGDHQKSLRTDRITSTEHRYHIGFNPYFDPSYVNIFSKPDILNRYLIERVPPRLRDAFRGIILDYYEELAADKNIGHPIYFAEKSLPERDSRHGIRYMFPNIREIILVRDFRDMICSSTASNGLNFDKILKDTLAGAKVYNQILDEDRASVLLVKYEDFILRREETRDRITGFLGLAPIRAADERMKALFEEHATSSSPAASIGRWRKDMTDDQKAKSAVLNRYLDRLGYEV